MASILHEAGDKYWFDLNSRDSPGSYVYTDGSSPSYTHWGNNQPDNTDIGACVSLNEDDNGLWYDEDCAVQHSAICEKPHATETQPTSIPTVPSGQCHSGWQEYNGHCYFVRFPS